MDESKNTIPFTLKKANYLVVNPTTHLQDLQAADHNTPVKEIRGALHKRELTTFVAQMPVPLKLSLIHISEPTRPKR